MHVDETASIHAPTAPEFHRISNLPIFLLNVHEHCNCRCVMCDIWQRKNGKELDVDDFARHRESLVRLGVRQVVLTGGEPLLHQNLQGICQILRDCGARITLLTTGLLLSQRAQVIAEYIDEIIISIDGPEDVHDQIRRVKGAFRLIREGIQIIRQVRSDIPIHGRSTVQKANHVMLRQTVASAKLLSLDSISFLAADVTSTAFNRELVWPDGRQARVILTTSEISQLEDEIEKLLDENADDFVKGYIVETPEKLRRIAKRFREHLRELPPVAPICNAPWISAVMEVDGRVRPCFFHKAIGDASKSTLEEVINGEVARDFRARLDVSTNPTCQNCVCSLNFKPTPGDQPALVERRQRTRL